MSFKSQSFEQNVQSLIGEEILGKNPSIQMNVRHIRGTNILLYYYSRFHRLLIFTHLPCVAIVQGVHRELR